MSRVYHLLWARIFACVLPVTLAGAAPGALYGAEVTLTWDANPEPAVAGYRLYYGEASGRYHGAVRVGKTTTYTLSGLREGQTYYVAVTAYDEAGQESGFSAEVRHRPLTFSASEDVGRESVGPIEDHPRAVGPAPASGPVQVWIEAEDGTLAAPAELGSDGKASGGHYLWVPDGWGDVTNLSYPAGEARYAFEVPAGGVYLIWGRVQAAAGDDSFHVVIDGNYEEAARWDTAINDRGVGDPALFFLEAGEHTLHIIQREDGTKIDQILITNDFDYTPAGSGQ